MSEAMIDWLVQNLGGRIGKEFIAFIISMIPILELRGGLLAAGPAILDIPMWQAIADLCDRKSSPYPVYPSSYHEDL